MSAVVTSARSNGMLAGWRVTGLLALNLLLWVLLFLWPYFLSKPAGEYEYQLTHNSGLDPREHWPFAWDGLGGALYMASLWFAHLAGPVTLVLLVAQIRQIAAPRAGVARWYNSLAFMLCGANLLLLVLWVIVSPAAIQYLLD